GRALARDRYQGAVSRAGAPQSLGQLTGPLLEVAIAPALAVAFDRDRIGRFPRLRRDPGMQRHLWIVARSLVPSGEQLSLFRGRQQRQRRQTRLRIAYGTA